MERSKTISRLAPKITPDHLATIGPTGRSVIHSHPSKIYFYCFHRSFSSHFHINTNYVVRLQFFSIHIDMWISESTLSHPPLPILYAHAGVLSHCMPNPLPLPSIPFHRLASWLQSKSKVSAEKNVNKKRAQINIAARILLATLKNQTEWNDGQRTSFAVTALTDLASICVCARECVRTQKLFTSFRIQCTVSPTWWHWLPFSRWWNDAVWPLCIFLVVPYTPTFRSLSRGPMSKWRLQLKRNNMFVSLIWWVGRVAYTISELPKQDVATTTAQKKEKKVERKIV